MVDQNIRFNLLAGRNTLNTELQKAQKTTDSLKSSLKGIIVGAFTVQGVRTLTNYVDQANRLDRSMIALNRSTGGAASSLVQMLQEASKGEISLRDLTLTASKAATLIPDGMGRIAELMEVARGAAVQMGTDTTTAFNDIITGIGRQSRMILDNLGLIVSVTEANRNYAEKLGITVGELTDAQKKQAFLNEALEQGKEKFGDLSEAMPVDQLARFRANIDNLRISLGREFAPTFNAIFGGMADSVENVDKLALAIKNLTIAVIGLGAAAGAQQLGNIFGGGIGGLLRQKGGLIAGIAPLGRVFPTKALSKQAAELPGLFITADQHARIASINATITAQRTAVLATRASWLSFGKVLGLVGVPIALLIKAWDSHNKKLAEVDKKMLTYMATAQDTVKALDDVIKQQNDMAVVTELSSDKFVELKETLIKTATEAKLFAPQLRELRDILGTEIPESIDKMRSTLFDGGIAVQEFVIENEIAALKTKGAWASVGDFLLGVVLKITDLLVELLQGIINFIGLAVGALIDTLTEGVGVLIDVLNFIPGVDLKKDFLFREDPEGQKERRFGLGLSKEMQDIFKKSKDRLGFGLFEEFTTSEENKINELLRELARIRAIEQPEIITPEAPTGGDDDPITVKVKEGSFSKEILDLINKKTFSSFDAFMEGIDKDFKEPFDINKFLGIDPLDVKLDSLNRRENIATGRTLGALFGADSPFPEAIDRAITESGKAVANFWTTALSDGAAAMGRAIIGSAFAIGRGRGAQAGASIFQAGFGAVGTSVGGKVTSNLAKGGGFFGTAAGSLAAGDLTTAGILAAGGLIFETFFGKEAAIKISDVVDVTVLNVDEIAAAQARANKLVFNLRPGNLGFTSAFESN